MNYTVNISGMNCGHCVSSVKNALASNPEITVTDVQIGSAQFQSTVEVSAENITELIENIGFDVISVVKQ